MSTTYNKHPNGKKADVSNELALGYRSIVAGKKKGCTSASPFEYFLLNTPKDSISRTQIAFYYRLENFFKNLCVQV